jgi:carboxypeptidase family protein/TonB-dependent receptor-like protein
MRASVLLVAVGLLGRAALAQSLAGTVVDSASGNPVVGARLVLLDSTGTALRATVTSTDGKFTFTLPRLGQYRVLVSRIGYPSLTTRRFVVDSGFTARVSLTVPSTPITLDTVTVLANGVEKRLQYLADAGFYQRRRVGFGHFLTRAEIDKRDALIFSDLLHDMPGVRVTCTGARHCGVTMRAATTMFFRGTCHPSVVLDGVLLQAGGTGSSSLGLDDLINPFNVEAVEVYPGPEGVPVQYSGYLSPCGAIIVWSRR